MHRNIPLFAGIVLLVAPAFTSATCSPNGATIVYVNGIETTRDQADSDTSALVKTFAQYDRLSNPKIVTGYNPTHLDGFGDELESISQAFNQPVSDLDLTTILAQIASEVSTQKLLLLGYSQGSFYANEMYDYLVSHDLPAGSVAVYNVATPASFVSGGGKYLTSGDDTLINQVRVWDAEAGLPQPLPANILVEPQFGDTGLFGGHRFGPDYLTGAASRIVSGIDTELAELIASGNTATCITSPPMGVTYDLQKSLLSIADPLTVNVDRAAKDTEITLTSINKNANDIVHSALADAYFSVFPKPDVQSAAGVFAVEKALYGSSLSESDYQALLNGQNPEEVVTAPSVSSQSTPDIQQQIAPAPQPEFQDIVQPTTSPQALPTTGPVTATSVASITMVSPGFGGGGEPFTVSQTRAVTALQPTTSSQEVSPPSDASPQIPTTTPPVVSDASSTGTVQASTTSAAVAAALSPVTDDFNAGFSGWRNYADGWSTSVWSTSTSDCYSGNCLSENVYNQQYENIKKGSAATAGSFVLYFRNNGYSGAFGAGVCVDDTPNECQDFSRIGGADALTTTYVRAFRDNVWHYLFFAFRDGATDKEYCGLVDDSDPSDCGWQESTVASGTSYSDVMFFTSNGLNPEASFYWDELGTTTRASGQ